MITSEYDSKPSYTQAVNELQKIDPNWCIGDGVYINRYDNDYDGYYTLFYCIETKEDNDAYTSTYYHSLDKALKLISYLCGEYGSLTYYYNSFYNK